MWWMWHLEGLPKSVDTILPHRAVDNSIQDIALSCTSSNQELVLFSLLQRLQAAHFEKHVFYSVHTSLQWDDMVDDWPRGDKLPVLVLVFGREWRPLVPDSQYSTVLYLHCIYDALAQPRKIQHTGGTEYLGVCR